MIYTTHDMEEADKICQRIAIMDHGKLKALGTSGELKELQGHSHRITIELRRHDQKLVDELAALAGAVTVNVNGNVVELLVKKLRHDTVYRLSDFLHRRNIDIGDFQISEPTLEEVFIGLTKKELRD